MRWAQLKKFKCSIEDRVLGEVAGIKSVCMEISGDCVYGLLSGEKGTHRLVRNSPFNSANMRQTSFAAVEVMPVLGLLYMSFN